MKIKEISLSLLIVASLFCSQGALAQQTPVTASDPVRDLAPRIERLMRDWDVPGLSIAVIKADTVRHRLGDEGFYGRVRRVAGRRG
jgi:hypothetical protein